MNKTMILVLSVLMIALAACETRVIMEQPGVPQSNTLNVNGMTEFDVAPDLAKIRFSIQTQSLTAQAAQQSNREVSNSVHAALTQSGIRANEIQTADYRIERIQEWDENQRRTVDRGYRAYNTFIVSTKKLDGVGGLLDVGVQAGATNVESISFELSDAKQKEVKTEALRKASMNAREKAEALAEGAGVRLGKVNNIQEQSYYVTPFYRGDMMMAKAEMGPEMPSTPISPQDVKVSAQVSVTYEIG